MAFDKVNITTLPVAPPPFPPTGGRGSSPAGEMAQIINGEAMRLVTYIEFNLKSQPRGNHFHSQKVEVIYVIKGHLRLICEDIETSERKTFELRAGDIVRVQPNCAHAYTALDYTQAIELNEAPYDISDTKPYELV